MLLHGRADVSTHELLKGCGHDKLGVYIILSIASFSKNMIPQLSLYITAPHLSAVITTNGLLDEGVRYSLMCAVRGDERLAVSGRSFRWDRVGGSIGIERTAALTFNELRHRDEGEYRCTSTITSPYLTNSRTVTNTTTVRVMSKCAP